MQQPFTKSRVTTLGSRALGWVALGVLALAARPGAAAPASAKAAPAPVPSPPMSLKVMTFNLRYASTQKPNAWEQRRPVNRELIRRSAPDIIGTQEGLFSQLKDMAADQPDYSWLGLGREGGSHGEFMAVFYRKSRFDVLEYDHFWLSDTPDRVGSSTWGNDNRRMVTWIRFLDHETNREFYFWNTHLDHAIQDAREKGASLIVKRMSDMKPNLPLILTGDFNAPARANKAYDILTGHEAGQGGLTDTWFSAKQHTGQNYASFHGYEPLIPDGPHIDWILTRGDITALDEQVVSFQQNGQYPSDHFPIMATLLVGEGQAKK